MKLTPHVGHGALERAGWVDFGEEIAHDPGREPAAQPHQVDTETAGVGREAAMDADARQRAAR